jgi:hypothetical protein
LLPPIEVRNIRNQGLVVEVVIGDDRLSGRPLGKWHQQVDYFLLKHVVCWEPDCIAEAFRFHVLVNLRLCKGGIRPK